jgi:hypothetical protein
MTEPIINGKYADLGKNTVVAITMSVKDIGSIGSNKGTSTNQYQLPKTKNNIEIYEAANIVGSVTNIPYSKLSCIVKVDGIEVLNGYCILKDVGQNFNIETYAGNASFYEEIAGLTVTDALPADKYEHLWSGQKIADYSNNTTGFIYPIVDASSEDNSIYIDGKVDIRLIAPAIYVHSLIDNIATNAGYKLRGKIFNDAKYKSLIFPKINGFANYGLSENIVREPINDDLTFERIARFFPTQNEVNLYWQSNRISINAKAEISYRTSGAFSGPFAFVFEMTYIDAATLVFTTVTSPLINATTTTTTYSHTFPTFANYIGQGRTWIDVNVRVITPNIAGNIGNSTVTGTMVQNVRRIENIGDFLQSDLIKTVAIMFGQIIQADDYKKELTFSGLNELQENIPLAIDWSDKIDESKQDNIDYQFGNYAQLNELKYKEDKANPINYGSGFFNIADTTLEVSNVIYELPVASTEMATRLGIRMAKLNLHTFGTLGAIEQRILRVEQTGARPITLTILSNNAYNETINANWAVGSFDGLEMQAFLAENYGGLLSMLNRAKRVVCNFNLKAIDVHFFDFFIPVYVQKYQGYFFVNKITDFKKGTTTTTELIKI